MPLNPTPWLQRQQPASLVIFRALQIGDMLCAVPALRALRQALPEARIALVGLPWAEQFASRFARYVDEFIAFPGHTAFPEQQVRQHELADFYAGMRARRFDVALQMHGNGQHSNLVARAFGARALAGYGDRKGADGERFLPFPETGEEPLRLLQLTAHLGAPDSGSALEFPITDADERELGASGLAAGLDDGSYVCIHPGARVRDKCWPPVRFAQVADRLAAEFGVRIVLTGSGAERELTGAVARSMRQPSLNAAAPISVGAMAALMRHARLLVCNDTGVSHLAAALRLPSVVVFSKADIRRWAPLDRDLHRCLWDPRGERVPDVIAHARALFQRP
jgi:ADP-heptose:LPS heptosyltransferase